MPAAYPPIGFFFSIYFVENSEEVMASFQEVSGLLATKDMVEIENSFTHKIHSVAKFQNLVLKRGFIKNNRFSDWCRSTLDSGLGVPITTKSIIVSLMTEGCEPLVSWNFMNAWPVKWEVAAFAAEKDGILIESIEFTYSYFEKRNMPA